MRFTTLIATNKKAFLVRLKDVMAEPIGRAYERPGVDPLRELLDAGRDPKRVRAIAKPFAVRGRRYGPVVTAPQKVIAVGLNYKNHQDESGLPVPVAPQSFCKGNYKKGLTFPARLPIFHCVEGRHGHGEESTRQSPSRGTHRR